MLYLTLLAGPFCDRVANEARTVSWHWRVIPQAWLHRSKIAGIRNRRHTISGVVPHPTSIQGRIKIQRRRHLMPSSKALENDGQAAILPQRSGAEISELHDLK